jgi:hypothetical protein
MKNLERALRPDFVEHMSLGDRWPKTTAFETWLAQRGDGVRHGEFHKLKNGKVVKSRLVVQFVELLADESAKGPDIAVARAAALEFLRAQGIDSFEQHSSSIIAKLLLSVEDDDFLGKGVDGLVDILLARPKCERFVNACNDEDDVKEAVCWMFVAVGRQIQEGQTPLKSKEAIQDAAEYMRISLKEYQKRAIDWWQFDPWTVMLARGNRVARAGMSIILPLRQATYDRIKAGAHMGYETTPADMERPSRLLLLEGAAARPEDRGGEQGETTKHAMLGLMCQLAILSYCEDQRRKLHRTAVTFGGTPKTEASLRKAGFKPTGAKMGETELKVYERPMSRSGKDTLLDFILNGIGEQADRWLTPPKNLGPKKKG